MDSKVSDLTFAIQLRKKMTTNVLIPSIEKQMFIPGTGAQIIGCGQNCPAIGTDEQVIESDISKIQFSANWQ